MPDKKLFTFAMMAEECWYGGAAVDGIHMPFTAESAFHRSLDPNETTNQAAPLLVSNRGRYIACSSGFDLTIENGTIAIASSKGVPVLYDGYETLRGAYMAACSRLFPPNGQCVPDAFFDIQFNSWIELTYHQTQENILRFARGIEENGFPCSVFMIDDGWSESYGNWKFHSGKFPDPKGMIDELHGYGYKVMLWVCPFVTCDKQEFRYCMEQGLLVQEEEKSPSVKKWWNGYSAVLDLSNPRAVDWLKGQLDALISDYGVDGFKFDAGDASFYSDGDRTAGNVTANEQSELWARFAENYRYNELRACFKRGARPLVQRQCDKLNEWGEDGIASIVPCGLAQGIIGSLYSCPDMIGGGNYLSFTEERIRNADRELFVRYAQIAALMPMMQFSAAPWRALDESSLAIVRECVALHRRYRDYILETAHRAASSGEPMLRYLEYEFPHEGLARVIDQFMLGDRLLVCPVLKSGARSRRVVLPSGRWKGFDGALYEGGQTLEVSAGLSVLPYFERADK